MKKFFRLVSVLALAGAAFAYTGCTDYSGDIKEVNNRVDGTEQSIQNIQGQIASLQSTVNGLQSAQATADAAIKTLQDGVAALESELAELKTAHAKDIAGLQGQIGDLQTAHAKDIATLNAAIDGIKAQVAALEAKAKALEEVIPTLAAKSWVEATFATKAEVAEINTKVGALEAFQVVAEKQFEELAEAVKTNAAAIAANAAAIAENAGAIEALNAAVEALNTKVDDEIAKVTAAVEKAQAAADAAQATADEALGKVDALVEALGVYAQKGALEAKIALIDLKNENQDAAIKDLDEKKLNIADFQKKFDEAFDAAIKAAVAEDGIVYNEIARQVKEAKDALQAQIDVLNTKVNKIFGLFEGRITNLTIVPDAYCNGVPVIEFKTLYYDYKNATYWSSSKSFSTVKYRIAPKASGINGATFAFVGDKAVEHEYGEWATRAITSAPAAPIALSDVENPIKFDEKTGYATFAVRKVADFRDQIPPYFGQKTPAGANEFDIVALEATIAENLLAEGETDAKVYSEYAKVEENMIFADQLFISDVNLLKKNQDCHYVQTLAEGKALVKGDIGFYTCDYNKPFDLKALAATCFEDADVAKHNEFDIEDYDLHYEFFIDSYAPTSAGTVTEQNHVLAMKKGTDKLDGVFVTVDKNGEECVNMEAVGREPVLRIELKHFDRIVRTAFVKLLITVPHAEDILVNDLENEYETTVCYTGSHNYVINEQRVWEEVYQRFNMPHELFWDKYELASSSVTINGAAAASTFPVPQIVDGVEAEGVATKKVTWSFTEAQVGEIKGASSTIIGTLVLKNRLYHVSDLPMQVIFTFKVVAKAPNYNPILDTFKSERIDKNFWDGETLVANVAVPADPNDIAANCQFNTPFEKAPWKVVPQIKVPECFSALQVRIKSVTPANAKAGVSIKEYNGEKSIALDKSNENVKAALDKEELAAVLEYFVVGPYNKEFSLMLIDVDFVKPVHFALPVDSVVEDAVDGGDKVVDFDYTNLFVDWRGAAVYPGTLKSDKTMFYFWQRTSRPERTYVPASQKTVSEAWDEYVFGEKVYEVTTQTVGDVITLKDEVVKASATVKYSPAQWALFRGSFGLLPPMTESAFNRLPDLKTMDFEGFGKTESEAKAALRSKITTEFGAYATGHIYDNYYNCGMTIAGGVKVEKITLETAVEEGGVKIVESSVTFWQVVEIKHHEAVYEEVPEKWVVDPIEMAKYNTMPVAGVDYPFGTELTEGYTVGYWTWTKVFEAPILVVDRPQMYWDFYGKFSPFVELDMTKVTTDLNTGVLPSTVTLTQVGNTVKFHNNGSPVMEEYHIYIPAKVKYGWGTLTDTLVITVLPIQK